MAELADGASAEVQGTTNWYTISRRGNVYSCTCPAWLNQRLPIEQRVCKHIRAYLGGYALSSTAPLPGAPEYDEAQDVRGRREEILTRSLERYVVLYDKMEESFGLRMPETLAYGAGFFLALSKEERARITDGPGLLGVATWFDETSSSSSSSSSSTGDERLRDRKRDDPPELVAVLSGQNGDRFGLWYDDPKELPSDTARRGPEDRAKTVLFETTLMRTLFDQLLAKHFPTQRNPYTYQMEPVLPEPPRDRVDLAILSWLSEVARRELTAPRGPMSPRHTGVSHSGVTPFIRGWNIPDDLMGWSEINERLSAYQSRPKNENKVSAWIGQALQEIKDGAPGRALLLGQELNWFGAPGDRAPASELLVRAYAALGRRALADILRAQYMHFDPQLPVFEMPPPHAVVNAAASGDPSDVARALAEGDPPTGEEVAEALANATSVAAATALLDIDATQTDSALWRRLGDLSRPPNAQARALVQLFVTRGMVNARAYGRLFALRADNIIGVELLDVATERVDIFSEDTRGKTPLHLAAAAADPKAVRALLDRGADASSEDSSGRPPYEDARIAWRVHANEAGEIFKMLEAAGGGPKVKAASVLPEIEDAREALAHKPPPPKEEDFEWSDGIDVHHARFGDGVVEEVLGGEGDETKLKIRFENETKNLLAKFVKRV